jgi:hypothetical protein
MKINFTKFIFKSVLAGLLLIGLLFAENPQSIAQTISPYLLGNNYWYNGTAVAYVMQPGGLMDQSNVQTVRIGGFGPNTYTDAQYLEYIRRIKAMGALPIVQVRATLTTQQAIDFIKLVNVTNGLGVRVWSIGNEPDHPNGGSQSDAQIADYTKRIASALKSVDPTITVAALEFSEYNAGRYANLIGGVNSVTGLVPGKDYYYVDVVGFHRYVIKDASEVLGSINDLVGKVNNANLSRPDGKKLQWGMGEFNSHYNNDKTTDPDMKVWSFNNGQFHAELWGIGMQKSAFSLDSWSMLEGEVERAGTDLSLFDKNYAGRSTYWHTLMLGQNMKANYRTSNDNQTSVAVVAMGDASGTAVMIINKNKTTGYSYTLRLDNGALGTTGLQISVNAGINATNITGTIDATTTQMLVFCSNGTLLKRYTYTKANADARTGPKIEQIATNCVNTPVLTTITVTPTTSSINKGETKQLSAVGKDQFGTVMTITPTWTATGGTINSGGLFSGTVAGTFIVKAQSGTVFGTASITVNDISNPFAIPGKIEAEAYNAMFGIQTEATTDAGGGLNIGYIDANDWIDYNVNVSTSGAYVVSFRVASALATGAFQLKVGSTVLTSTTVPNTGGWQVWKTITMPVTLTQGMQTIRILASGAGFNLNWLDFAVAPNSIKIEAESYSSMFGIQTEATTDAGGGLNVGYTDPGDYMNYLVNVPTTGTYTINFRVASLVTTGSIQLKNSSGTVLATLIQGSTGGWQTWVTKSVTANLTAGSQTLQIYYTGAGLNINWFELVGPLKSAEEFEIQTNKFSVFPNPANDRVIMEWAGSGFTNLKIYSSIGTLVYSQSILDDQGVVIDLSNFDNGMYIINLSGLQTVTEKLIIRK